MNCNKTNWFDPRHKFELAIVNNSIKIWPIDPNAMSFILSCKCGLTFEMFGRDITIKTS